MTIDYTKPPSSMPGAPPQPGETKKSGCGKAALIGCGVAFALLAVFVCGIVYFVFGLIRSDTVYKQALHRAQTNPDVIARLGQPIEPGWWISGSLTVNNASGSANFSFPIAGPNGKATVHVEATRENDRWSYSVMRARPGSGAEIDLLAAP